jgi:hypothetical protein
LSPLSPFTVGFFLLSLSLLPVLVRPDFDASFFGTNFDGSCSSAILPGDNEEEDGGGGECGDGGETLVVSSSLDMPQEHETKRNVGG